MTQTTIFLTAGWTLAGVGALVVLWALFKDRARGRRRCARCWYDMSGAAGLTCPECGRTAKRERRLFRTRRRWRWAAVGVLLCVAAFPLARTPQIRDEGVWGLVPIWALNAYLSLWSERAEALWDARFEPSPPEGPYLDTAGLSNFDRLLLGHHLSRLLRRPCTDDEPFVASGAFYLDARARPAVPALLARLGRANQIDDPWSGEPPVSGESIIIGMISRQFPWVHERLERMLLHDDSAERRIDAASALMTCVKFSVDRDVSALLRAVEEEPDPKVRDAVASILAKGAKQIEALGLPTTSGASSHLD